MGWNDIEKRIMVLNLKIRFMIFWPFVCDVVKIPLSGAKNQWFFRLESDILCKILIFGNLF